MSKKGKKSRDNKSYLSDQQPTSPDELMAHLESALAINHVKFLYSQKTLDLEAYVRFSLEYIAHLYVNVVSIRTKIKEEKDNEVSRRIREQGNKLYSSRADGADVMNLRKVIECYTKSIAYAIPGSKEMALGYANRSAVLLKVKRHKECLDDIQRALQLNYPEESKPKLLIRQAVCFSKLAADSYIDANNFLRKVPLNDENRASLMKTLRKHDSTKLSDKYIDEEDLIPEIASRHAKFPCASDAVDVRFNKKFGRHLVATRDIEIGEVLVVEKIYSQAVDIEDKIYTHCAYCLRFLLTGIPCDQCVTAVYCSVECKTNAWNDHHRFDCILYDIHEGDKNGTLSYGLAVKLLFDMVREAGGLKNFKERVEKHQKCPNELATLLSGEWYQKPTLESILTLMSHENKFSKKNLMEIGMDVSWMLFILPCYTDFFGIQYDRDRLGDSEINRLLSQNPDVIFFGAMLFRVIMILCLNRQLVLEEDSGKVSTRGAVITPFLSLINHSCNPNTFRQSKRNYIVLHAVAPIKKNEQIMTNYELHLVYSQEPKDVRTQILQTNYHITCSCIACVEDWPVFNEQIQDTWSYMIRSKSSDIKNKLSKILALWDSIDMKITKRDFRKKDKMLKQIHEILTALHEGVNLPCVEIRLTLPFLLDILVATGACAKLQLKPAQK